MVTSESMTSPLSSKLILIDNFDSFTYNLVQAFRSLGAEVLVYTNATIAIPDIEREKPTHLLLGPGPGSPSNAGALMNILGFACERMPILGVCLGHQAIGLHYGATLVQGKKGMHGKSVHLEHSQDRLFTNLPSPMQVGLYNSLALIDIPEVLHIDSVSSDGTIMAISHQKHPIFGVQFHPESILSPMGMHLLNNFLETT